MIGVPNAGFEEEMQTKITFANESIDLETLHHENMHQWWGDNVSEANYNLTFFKEGLATLGEFLFIANNAQVAAGRLERGLRAEPRRQLQPVLRGIRPAVDRRTVGSASVHALLGLEDIHPARHRVHRAAPDPRPGELRGGAAADPGHVSAGEHHRGSARVGVRVLPPVANSLLHARS